MAQHRRIAILTDDTIAAAMAGPAIRAVEIAKALSSRADVTLVSTVRAELAVEGFAIECARGDALRAIVRNADVVIFQGHLLQTYPWIGEGNALVVSDLYDPMHIEQLEQVKDLALDERVKMTTGTVDSLNVQITRADFMICATERQRDLWLGQLGALGRINPATYDHDPTLRSLIDVVPFGVQDAPPQRSRPAIKGVVPGISEHDKVVLWGGGIYNWFDPLTVIRAIAELAHRHDDIRLFFLGVQHPNPNVPTMRMAFRARALAEELGLLDRVVFFNDTWVEYDDRVNYLLDSDVGVSTHFPNIETRFSFRTRMLDYLWASLPIVATEGDVFADLIETEGLGAVVPPEDVAALAKALETCLYDDAQRSVMVSRIAAVANRFRWSAVLAPLIRFSLEGEAAADLRAGITIAATERVEGLQTRIRGLEQSLSWRVTAPLRAITTSVRRVLRRGPRSDRS